MDIEALLDNHGKRLRHLETLEAMMAQIYGWDGAAWRKLSMLWGYSDRWHEAPSDTAEGAGDAVCDTSLVSDGEVWVLEAIALHHDAGANKVADVKIVHGAEFQVIYVNATMATGVWIPLAGHWTLTKDDYVEFYVTAPGAGKVATLQVWGYKMKVAE